ncbi:MAG: carbohydrate-binding family 9-like protein, partial [Bacteroidia bacterium]|nr:carbohydrate-binding family 9-like protein [Bacteroidia bacterium]
MMKTLNVRKIEFASEYPTLEEISKKFDELNIRNQISKINWKDFEYKPEVTFSVGYTEKELLLKYYVTEQYFKAEKTESNQMVCEDSCVEFFVSPCDDGVYYNFEFNGIGTCLLGTGTRRENSTKTDPEIIAKIRRVASAGEKPVKETKGKFSWTITIAIPLDVFFHHGIEELKGQTFRANFYKCGDKL